MYTLPKPPLLTPGICYLTSTNRYYQAQGIIIVNERADDSKNGSEFSPNNITPQETYYTIYSDYIATIN